jgi:hypothetical protein
LRLGESSTVLPVNHWNIYRPGVYARRNKFIWDADYVGEEAVKAGKHLEKGYNAYGTLIITANTFSLID